MDLILTTITVVGLALCGVDKSTIQENLEVTKKQTLSSEKVVVYKKVPTKWIKINKNSN